MKRRRREYLFLRSCEKFAPQAIIAMELNDATVYREHFSALTTGGGRIEKSGSTGAEPRQIGNADDRRARWRPLRGCTPTLIPICPTCRNTIVRQLRIAASSEL